MKKLLPFEDIRRYLVDDIHVREEIVRTFKSDALTVLRSLARGEDLDLPDADVDTFLLDLLHNDGRIYKRYTAYGSYGGYHIDIRGLGGVYFYWAPEFDTTGYFLSVDDASNAIEWDWADNLASSRGRTYRPPFLRSTEATERALSEIDVSVFLASRKISAQRHHFLHGELTDAPGRNESWDQYPNESYPGFDAPLVVKSHQTGRVACGLAKFGLIPSWAKDDKISRHTYNARSETVAVKPSYRGAWKQRQFGLIFVDNFFEPSYESGRPVRWGVELASGDPFGIACLWDRWTNPATGELVVSFSMLTANADHHPVMRNFHKPGDEKRTPVVIRPDLFDAWLSADTGRASELMTWSHMAELTAAPAPKT